MKKLLFLMIALCCMHIVSAQTLQRVAPEQVGMDSRRLMYTDELIETAIANEEIPGAVLAVVKDG
ncbi:MAG: esterase, partial [Bacteroidaceae bacterium]|nr:esterase [Bacteroidaceae bacterium]